MTTEEWLVKNYGILLTMTDLAHLLNRSDDGIRVTISGESDFSKMLKFLRIKIGRRSYFRAKDVAQFIDSRAAK